MIRHDSVVTSACFSPGCCFEKASICTASQEGCFYLFNIATSSPEFSFGHENAIYSIAFDPEGRYVATGGKDEVVHIHELQSGYVQELNLSNGVIYKVLYHPQRAGILATASGDGHLLS